jgi:uncharacterized protein YcbK (DUF882 family)
MPFLPAPNGAPAQSRVVLVQRSSAQDGQDYRLLLYNTHTAQRIEIVYRRGGQYIPDALAQLDYFLRDHRTGDVRHFDPRLYDILTISSSIGHSGGEIDIAVRATALVDERVALRSHYRSRQEQPHIQAEAIDLRMPGIDTLELRKAALSLRRGGVGYYPHSDFIHVDVGRFRQWCFDCPAGLTAGD